jgi:hypothetical protein
LIKKTLLIKTTTITVLFVLAIQYYIQPNVYFTFSIPEIIICSLPLIGYAFIFILQNIDNKSKHFMYINAGVFFYLSCSTLLFSTGNLPKSPVTKFIWHFNKVLYLAYQILVFVDWYKNFRKPLKE